MTERRAPRRMPFPKGGSRRTAAAGPDADAPAARHAPEARRSFRADKGSIGVFLGAIDRAEFPESAYLDGPSEPVKAALLGELKAAWERHAPEAPPARVFRAAECGVEEILAAYHGASLFHPRELSILLEVEDLGRSDKKIVALAEGIARPGESACLIVVESASDAVREKLEPLRRACRMRIEAGIPSRAELLAWGRRRFRNESLEAEPGVAEAVVDACEEDALPFFNEIDKLVAYCGASGTVRVADARALLAPVVGAALEEYLAAVARGDSALAAQRLGRILAAGEGEGGVLWALGNLVGGALGGWSRHREISAALRRRTSPRGLARALDAVYRAESAWKEGRAGVVAVLEQATREVCAAE